MSQSINLLLSLPTDIQSEIYQYDNTYRIFGNDDFKKELTDALLNSKVAFNKYLKEITQYVTSLTYDDKFYWNNEYGCIDPNNELQKNKTIIRTYADFFIVLDYKNGALYFKILPQGSTVDNCQFLRKPNKYDGYFLDENRNTNLSKDELDKLCISYTTDITKINDINELSMEKLICLYFVYDY